MASSRTSADLHGLVLAGGESRRMGRDKGALEVEGEPQVARAYALLGRVVSRVDVSVRAVQAGSSPYTSLPLILDATDSAGSAGPAAGLLAAWAARPDVALLVLAVDMPRVDAGMLEHLIAARDPEALATAFTHADGTPEPLCTIWEPAARRNMTELRPGAGVSLRRLLEGPRVKLVPAPEPRRLESVNAPDDLERL